MYRVEDKYICNLARDLLHEFYVIYAHRHKRAVFIIGLGIGLCILCAALKLGFGSFVDAPEFLFAFIVCPICILGALEVDFLKFILGNKIVIAVIGNISMVVFFGMFL